MFFRRWRNFFQFIVLKGILLDPFVTQAIEYEISQAIQNVDGTVVVATVGGLQKGIESVEIAIGHLCQPNIFFLVLQTCIFMEVAAKTIILVGGQLRDSYADLFLSLLAIKHQLGQQHTNLLAGTFQPLFDFDGITLEPNTHHIEIIEQGLLVEPGSFVLDIKQAGPYFQKQGALGFINSFVNNALPGMKHPIHGVVDVLELIYNTHPTNQYGLSLAVSHDTILAAIIAVISGRNEVTQADWPDMMEGLFVWFEGDEFLESKLKWIWRGQIHTLDISQFRQKV